MSNLKTISLFDTLIYQAEIPKYLNEILSLIEELLDDLDYNYAVVSTRPGFPSLPCEDNALWMDQRKEVII